MRWDERSSTTLHRPLLSECVFPTVTLTQTQSHTNQLFISFTCLLAFPLYSPPLQHLLTHFLFALYTYIRNLQLSHSGSRTNTLTYVHLHSFFACPVSACSSLLPHEVCVPLSSLSTIFWWADILWQRYVYVWGEERFSNAMETSCPTYKADGLTGPCGDAHRHRSLVTGSVALISNLSNTCYWHSSYRSIKIQFWSLLPSIKHSVHNSDTAIELLGLIVDHVNEEQNRAPKTQQLLEFLRQFWYW